MPRTGLRRRPTPATWRQPRLEWLEDRIVPSLTFPTPNPFTNVSTGVFLPAFTVSSSTQTSGPVTLSLVTSGTSGTPILGGIITEPLNAGVATFPANSLVIYGGTGKGAYFIASSGTDTGQSASFKIASGPDHLYVSTQIPTVVAGAGLGDGNKQIKVLEQDARGSTVADNSLQVQLVIENNPGGASFVDSSGKPLTSAPQATVRNGVATFTGLMLNKAGLGYSIEAIPVSNSTLLPVISNSFDVVAGAPAGLSFQIQPTYTGISDQGINTYPSPQYFGWTGVGVGVQDKFGNPVPGPFTSGSATIAALDSSGNLVTFVSGKTTQSIDPNAATALFPGLQVGKMGNNFTLLATGSVVVNQQTVPLGASTTLASDGTKGSIAVKQSTGFPTTNKFLILLSNGTTSSAFQVTAGAGTTSWTLNGGTGDASAFKAGATVTLFAATSVPFNVGPQRAVGGTTALKFIVAPPASAPMGQTIEPNRILSMSSLNSIIAMTGAGVSPISITYPKSGLVAGDKVTIIGSTGNTAANGAWTVQSADANGFSLMGSTGNGAYTGGAGWRLTSAPITINYPGSGLTTGQKVVIAGAQGNTSANGTWTVTVNPDGTFSLNGSAANGFYNSGSATWSLTSSITSAVGAGNGAPIVIITGSTAGLMTGSTVIIQGSKLSAANGSFVITVLSATTFSLDGTSATGSDTSGSGTWLRDASSVQVAILDANGNVLTADSTDQLALKPGDFLGTKIQTVHFGVASFNDTEIVGVDLKGSTTSTVAFQIMYYILPNGGVTQNIVKLAGPAAALQFANPDVGDPTKNNGQPFTVQAGAFITDSKGNPLEVQVIDASKNVVATDDTTIVSIGVLATNGRGPVFVGSSATDPGSTDPSVYNYQFSARVTAGTVSFPDLYMNQVGANFILAAGTASFGAAAGGAQTSNVHSGQNPPPPGFSVVPGPAAVVKFANTVGTSNAFTSFNFTGVQPVTNAHGIVVGVFDNVGNVATGFSGSITLGIQSGQGGTVGGVATVSVYQGFAIFNQAYISATSTQLGQYSLSETVTTSQNPPPTTIPSNPFTLHGGAGGFTGTPVPSLSVTQISPSSPTSGQTFSVTVTVTKLDSSLYSSANLLMELRDANGNPLPQGPALQLVGVPPKLDSNGTATFTVSVALPPDAKKATTYTILALLDLDAQAAEMQVTIQPRQAPVDLLSGNNVDQVSLAWQPSPDTGAVAYEVLRGTTPGGENSTPIAEVPANTTSFNDTAVNDGTTYYYVVEAVYADGETSIASNETSGDPQGAVDGPSLPPLPITVDGLGNFTTNFDTISSNPVYTNTQDQGYGKVNYPPSAHFTSDLLTEAPKQEQPVAATGFNQAPVSNKWWSSLMFPQFNTPGATNSPVDSQGNQLFPLYANPLTALVNGSNIQLPGTPGDSNTIQMSKVPGTVRQLTVGMLVSGMGVSGTISNVDYTNNIITVAGTVTGTSLVTLTFNDYAGIGLSNLTALFLQPTNQFADPSNIPAGQPPVLANPNYPGAASFTYNYGGNSNLSLYQDFSVGLAGVKADGRVLAYSDATVKIDWGNGLLDATLGEDLPFAYFTAKANSAIQLVTSPKTNSDSSNAQVTVIANGTPGLLTGKGPLELEMKYTLEDAADGITLAAMTNSTNGVVKMADTSMLAAGMTASGGTLQAGTTILSVDSPTQITLSTTPGPITGPSQQLTFNSFRVFDHFYGIYLPKGVAWNLTSNTNGALTANLESTPYFSVATLPGPITLTANLVSGSTSVRMLQDTSFLYAGMPVTGPGGFSTTIVKVVNAYTITLAAAPTASANGVTLAFGTNDPTKAYNAYLPSAYTFVTGSTSSFNFNPSTNQVETSYIMNVTAMDGNPASGPIQALSAPQYNNLAADQSGSLLTDGTNQFTYVSPEGMMKVWNGPIFRTTLTYTGILPQVPTLAPDGTSDADLWHNYMLPIFQSISKGSATDGLYQLQQLFQQTSNNYFEFQSMYGAAQLVPILLEISQSSDIGLSANDKAQAASYAQQIYTQIKNGMGAWLSATNDQNLNLFYYQPPSTQESNPLPGSNPPKVGSKGWQTLISIAAGFGSDTSLNDHVLIAGYFVKVADFLEQYDSSWGSVQLQIASKGPNNVLPAKLGDMVNMVIGDVANYDRNSTMFPFLRNFDVYAGHSWVDGPANSFDGQNLESSSEALNFEAAVLEWGALTGNQATTDLGIYLYTTEVQSVDTYWLGTANQTDKNGTPTNAIPHDYLFFTDSKTGEVTQTRTLVTKVNGDGGSYTGFIGAVPARVTGIQIVPLSGSAYYLGTNPADVTQTFNLAIAGSTSPGFIPASTPYYLSVLYPYLALSNPGEALSLYTQNINSIVPVNPLDLIDNNAFNIHWMESLEDYGQVDTSAFAVNTVFYQVFKNNSVQTFVAYNSNSTPTNIVFKNAQGQTVYTMMNVAPGTIRVDQTGGKTIAQQTSPSFALQTPQNRFFFATKNTSGNITPILINGSTGGVSGTGPTFSPVPNEKNQYLDNTISINKSSPLTIEEDGLTGTLQGPSAQVYFELWLDAGTQTNGITPQIQVTISIYQNATSTTPMKVVYQPYNLSINAGFEDPTSFYRSPFNGTPFSWTGPYFPTLNNGKVVITIAITTTKFTGTVRLRSDAAAQQGDVSFIDLPYNLTQIGGTSIESESEPPQALTSSANVLGSTLTTAESTLVTNQVGWTATLDGTTATFTATGIPDQPLQITYDPASGLLMNNQFAAGNSNFASPFDFGDGQTLTADSTSTIIINGGFGDTITLGAPQAFLASPASALLANFQISSSDGTGSLTIDDSVQSADETYSIHQFGSGLLIRSDDAGIDVIETQALAGGVTLIAGQGATDTEVISTIAGQTLTLDSAGSNTSVDIGVGSTQGILGPVNVTNTSPGGFTDLFVNNEADVNSSNTVTVSPTAVTGLAPATISYDGDGVDDVEVSGGTNDTTYNVTGSIGGSSMEVFTGTGKDRVVIGNNGVIDDGLFPGSLDLEGEGQTSTLVLDNHSGSGVGVSVIDDEVDGFTSAGIFYGGFTSVNLELAAATGNAFSAATDGDGPGTVIVSSGADLALNATSMDSTSTLDLTATGQINVASGPVAAGSLVLHDSEGFGSPGSTVPTQVGVLAADVGTGGLFINNNGNLTIGSVDGVSGVTATGGAITIGTSGNLTVSSPINTGTAAGDAVSLSGVDVINILAPLNGASASVTGGGAGGNTVTIQTTIPVQLTVDGGLGSNSLIFNATNQPLFSSPGKLTIAGQQQVVFNDFSTINLNDASSISTFYGPDTADRSTALPGLTPAQHFVQVLYLNALGRVGSSSELAFWVGLLSAGAPQNLIANSIERSTEARDHLVATWYQTYLGRKPGNNEEQTWVNDLMNGQSEAMVLSSILGSQEFFNHAPAFVDNAQPSNAEFVEALYEVLLNRRAADSDVAFWVNLIPTIGRTSVAEQLLGSAEGRTDAIDALYAAILHRPADAAGLAGWLSSDLDATSLRVAFESTSEFFNNG